MFGILLNLDWLEDFKLEDYLVFIVDIINIHESGKNGVQIVFILNYTHSTSYTLTILLPKSSIRIFHHLQIIVRSTLSTL